MLQQRRALEPKSTGNSQNTKPDTLPPFLHAVAPTPFPPSISADKLFLSHTTSDHTSPPLLASLRPCSLGSDDLVQHGGAGGRHRGGSLGAAGGEVGLPRRQRVGAARQQPLGELRRRLRRAEEARVPHQKQVARRGAGGLDVLVVHGLRSDDGGGRGELREDGVLDGLQDRVDNRRAARGLRLGAVVGAVVDGGVGELGAAGGLCGGDDRVLDRDQHRVLHLRRAVHPDRLRVRAVECAGVVRLLDQRRGAVRDRPRQRRVLRVDHTVACQPLRRSTDVVRTVVAVVARARELRRVRRGLLLDRVDGAVAGEVVVRAVADSADVVGRVVAGVVGALRGVAQHLRLVGHRE
mmetsp:Transcript_31000/g.62910  ORF Transcript_31000/g.62910 Transcript_31000/m.62910 type:complete len:351 (+) Transcript_31000:47-1099(+)